ncbi:MAG TPA: dihydrolipoyl dehydrogenase [Desulfomonilaceae bacterium]|nr:dihydrolipoyl dehydrogenase [Desulfomonilaceae bacterium]
MAVIGGGPGGYVAALRGSQLGLNVLLVEKERVGGVCLNRGCIPTKALLSDVEGIHWSRRAAREGIILQEPEISLAAMMKRKQTVVDKLVDNLEKLLAAAKVDVLRAAARIAAPETVSLDTGETCHAGSIVIATGSTAWAPPISGIGLPGVLNTRQALELERIPESVVIIGGGVIGQEFASLFAGLGSKVTVLEVLDRILNEVDKDIAKRYATLVSARMRTETGIRVDSITTDGEKLKVHYEKRAQEKSVEADVVLLATGRRPYFDGLGLEELGIEIQSRAVLVDRRLRTSMSGVYAIGDVIGGKMLAHVASYHGEMVAENIAGHGRDVGDEPVPACIFTTPQIAWVGPTEEQAQESGLPYRTSMFSLSANGKALALGESRGWVKLMEDSTTGRLIAAHLLGPQVSELVSELALAIQKGLSAADIAGTIHPHPTLSESVREAALGFLGGPVHAAANVKSFNGSSPVSRRVATSKSITD